MARISGSGWMKILKSVFYDCTMAALNTVNHKFLLADYSFDKFGVIADIGGKGSLLEAILKDNPNAKGILFDRPLVTGKARKEWEESELKPRVELQGSDFFKSVLSDADAYILRTVIQYMLHHKVRTAPFC